MNKTLLQHECPAATGPRRCWGSEAGLWSGAGMPRRSSAAPAAGAEAPGKRAGMRGAERVTPGAWERGCGRSLVGAEHGNGRQEQRDAAKRCPSVPDTARRGQTPTGGGECGLCPGDSPTLPGTRPAPGRGTGNAHLDGRIIIPPCGARQALGRGRGGRDNEERALQTKGSGSQREFGRDQPRAEAAAAPGSRNGAGPLLCSGLLS